MELLMVSRQKPIGLKERLKMLRLRHRLTLEEVGTSVGSTKQTVHGWENGKSQPSLATLVRIAALYGVSTDELLGAEGDRSAKINVNAMQLYNKLLAAGYGDRQIERLLELALELATLRPKR
jgi:transcriptional regulator with XRE-family HTH domain